MNPATIVVLIIVAVIFLSIVIKGIINRKNGKSGCSCGCSGCAVNCSNRQKKDDK